MPEPAEKTADLVQHFESIQFKPGVLPHPWLEYRLTRLQEVQPENLKYINPKIISYFLNHPVPSKYESSGGYKTGSYEGDYAQFIDGLIAEADGSPQMAFVQLLNCVALSDLTEITADALQEKESYGQPLIPEELQQAVVDWKTEQYTKLQAGIDAVNEQHIKRGEPFPYQLSEQLVVNGTNLKAESLIPVLAEAAVTVLDQHSSEICGGSYFLLNEQVNDLEASMLNAVDQMESRWVWGRGLHQPTDELLNVLGSAQVGEAPVASRMTIDRLIGSEYGFLIRKSAADWDSIDYAISGAQIGDFSAFMKQMMISLTAEKLGRICAGIDRNYTCQQLVENMQAPFPPTRDIASLMLAKDFLDLEKDQKEVPLSEERTFPCWGRQFQVENPPAEAEKVERLSFETVGLFDKEHTLVGICDVSPWSLPKISETPTITGCVPLSLENITHRSKSGTTEDETPIDAQSFMKSFHSFYQPGGEFHHLSGLSVDPRMLPFELKFQLFQYMQKQDEEGQQRCFGFIRRFGTAGAYALMSLEFGDEVGDQVMDISDKVTALNDEDAFLQAKDMFATFGSIMTKTKEYVASAGIRGADQEIVEELILRRAKSILVATDQILAHPENGLTMADMDNAMRLYEQTLDEALIPEETQSRMSATAIDPDKIASYYWSHQGDPTVMDVCGSVFEAQWTAGLAQQEDAEYAQKIVDLTKEFYSNYRLIPKEERDKTMDAEADIARFTAIVEYANEKVPHTGPLRINPAGFGTGERVEQQVIRNIADKGIEAHWVASDLLKPDEAEIPPEVQEYREYNLNNPPEDLWGTMDAVIIPGSAPCDLVLDKDFIQMVVGVNRLLKPGGIGAWDDPFAFGEGSHEKRADAYHEKHSQEPWGVFSFDFEKQDGTPLQKLFRLRRPEQVKQILEACGLELVNPIDGETVSSLRHYQTSDSYTNNRFSPFDHGGVYKTSLDRMRQTVIFRKKSEAKDSESIVAQLNLQASS